MRANRVQRQFSNSSIVTSPTESPANASRWNRTITRCSDLRYSCKGVRSHSPRGRDAEMGERSELFKVGCPRGPQVGAKGSRCVETTATERAHLCTGRSHERTLFMTYTNYTAKRDALYNQPNHTTARPVTHHLRFIHDRGFLAPGTSLLHVSCLDQILGLRHTGHEIRPHGGEPRVLP